MAKTLRTYATEKGATLSAYMVADATIGSGGRIKLVDAVGNVLILACSDDMGPMEVADVCDQIWANRNLQPMHNSLLRAMALIE